jgi:hypothetical protein
MSGVPPCAVVIPGQAAQPRGPRDPAARDSATCSRTARRGSHKFRPSPRRRGPRREPPLSAVVILRQAASRRRPENPAARSRSDREICPPHHARPFRAPRAAGSRGQRGCAACPGMTKAGRGNARCLRKIPLLSLPKTTPEQPLTKIRPQSSRLTPNQRHNPRVPSHGGSLGRRSAAAAGAEGAGATRSRIPQGVAGRGDARSSRVESRTAEGGGVDTRTGPGDGRGHPCPPCAEGPLVNSEAHSPRMWKPVRAERQPSSKRYQSKLTGRRPGAPPTPPSPRPVRRAGRPRAPQVADRRSGLRNPRIRSLFVCEFLYKHGTAAA